VRAGETAFVAFKAEDTAAAAEARFWEVGVEPADGTSLGGLLDTIGNAKLGEPG
jgi:hypothetical protein